MFSTTMNSPNGSSIAPRQIQLSNIARYGTAARAVNASDDGKEVCVCVRVQERGEGRDKLKSTDSGKRLTKAPSRTKRGFVQVRNIITSLARASPATARVLL